MTDETIMEHFLWFMRLDKDIALEPDRAKWPENVRLRYAAHEDHARSCYTCNNVKMCHDGVIKFVLTSTAYRDEYSTAPWQDEVASGKIIPIRKGAVSEFRPN